MIKQDIIFNINWESPQPEIARLHYCGHWTAIKKESLDYSDLSVTTRGAQVGPLASKSQMQIAQAPES